MMIRHQANLYTQLDTYTFVSNDL